MCALDEIDTRFEKSAATTALQKTTGIRSGNFAYLCLKTSSRQLLDRRLTEHRQSCPLDPRQCQTQKQ